LLKDTSKPVEHSSDKRLPLLSGSRLALLYWLVIGAALVVLGVALLARLDFLAQQAGKWLNFPYFQPGSEGLILNEVSIIRSGQSIYVPLHSEQFISAPYPPLYYYLLNWLWPAETPYSAGFTTGRWISLISAFATALFITLLVSIEFRKVKSRWPGLLPGIIGGVAGSLLFLSLPAVGVWAVRVRADMLMTALGLAALVMVGLNPRSWPAFVGIGLLVLAFYTKQTALAAPAACLVYIIFQNWPDWKRILLWVSGFAVLLGGSFVVLNIITGLELYRRLFKYHNLPWLAENFQNYWGLFVGETLPLILLVAVLIIITTVVALAKWGGGFFTSLMKVGKEVPLVLWYILFSLPLLLGMGVAGADHNHFLPADAALCAGAGLLLSHLLTYENARFRLKWAVRWLTLPVIALLVWQAVVFSVPAQRYEIELRQRPDDTKALGKIIDNAAAHPSPSILTSEAGFFVTTGKPTTYNDLFTLAALKEQGLYDNSRLLQRVRNREFGLILAKDNFFTSDVRVDVWTPELVEAIRANYVLKFRDIWFTYEPKP
jgi:hypothetical protein